MTTLPPILPDGVYSKILQNFTGDFKQSRSGYNQRNFCANLDQGPIKDVEDRTEQCSRAILPETNFIVETPHVTQLRIDSAQKNMTKYLSPSGFIDNTRFVFLAGAQNHNHTEIYVYHTENEKLQKAGDIPTGARISRLFDSLLVVFPSLKLGSQFYIKDLSQEKTNFEAINTKIACPFTGNLKVQYAEPYLVFTEPGKSHFVIYNAYEKRVQHFTLDNLQKIISFTVDETGHLYALTKNSNNETFLKVYNLLDLSDTPREFKREDAQEIELHNDKIHILYKNKIVILDKSLEFVKEITQLPDYQCVEFLGNGGIGYITSFENNKPYQVCLLQQAKSAKAFTKYFSMPNDVVPNDRSLCLKASKISVACKGSSAIHIFDFSKSENMSQRIKVTR